MTSSLLPSKDGLVYARGDYHLPDCTLVGDPDHPLLECDCGSLPTERPKKIASAKPSPVALPFMKSPGGKRKLASFLADLIPATCRRYHEPFVGGGALFFHMANAGRFEKATLGDMNPEIANAYVQIRDYVENLIPILKKHEVSEAHYGAVRGWDPVTLPPLARAARFLYLNKTCFNGIWRVNRAGKFNVPWGRYKNPTICDEENLRRVARILQGVEILHRPFEAVLGDAFGAEDVVYFDPPYLPTSKTADFTSYTAEGFRLEDHERLRDVALELRSRGVHVLISNSATDQVRALYAGFAVHEVKMARSVNSKGSGRGDVTELVIT